MVNYEPKTIEELSETIRKASEKKVKIDNISYVELNKIREIDVDNLTAEVERGVTLGKLAQELKKKRLIFAPFTPDKEKLTVGEMYSQGVSSLTGAKYGNAKFHVMGLEVVLANGEILKTGGKTVKNVTGYDLTRVFLSSRDTIGIPVVYTLKLLPQEEKTVSFLITLTDYHRLKDLLTELAREKMVPAVCCFWNNSLENKKQLSLFMELRGIKEKVELEKQKMLKILYSIGAAINEVAGDSLQSIWQKIESFSTISGWSDCFKVPQDKLTEFITEINNQQIISGYWGNPLQGKINIHLKQKEKTSELYQKLSTKVNQLGGATSWYYDFQYGTLNKNLNNIFLKLKEKFDPQGILKPLRGETQ